MVSLFFYIRKPLDDARCQGGTLACMNIAAGSGKTTAAHSVHPSPLPWMKDFRHKFHRDHSMPDLSPSSFFPCVSLFHELFSQQICHGFGSKFRIRRQFVSYLPYTSTRAPDSCTVCCSLLLLCQRICVTAAGWACSSWSRKI